ncbi:exonuclease [Jannaschia sp. M317]|nr:exonuclease [Jannaschia sp. M317]
MQQFNQMSFRFIAVDVETANEDPASICQIGLAGVPERGEIIQTGTLINPRADFDPYNTNIHGITAQHVRKAPTFDRALEHLRGVLERHTLIQHSHFDERAIGAACDANRMPRLLTTWRDSVKIARGAWPELREDGGHGLANLKAKLDLGGRHHDAEDDALAAAQVVLLAEQHTGKNFEDILTARKQAARDWAKPISMDGNPVGPLHGLTACFTGQISLTRRDAAKIAADAGIEIKAGVSKKVHILVVGDQDLTLLAGHEKSSKHRKAEDLIAEGHDIRIVGETEFLALVGKT